MNYISEPYMEMKEMIYKSSRTESEVLYIEQYGNDRYIAVISICGSHPCGYIWHPFFKDTEDNGIYDEFDIPPEISDIVHGGFTFLGNLNKFDIINNLYVSDIGPWAGWDYAHYGDASYDIDGKFYTTEEIVEEGREAIKAIDIYIQRLEENVTFTRQWRMKI